MHGLAATTGGRLGSGAAAAPNPTALLFRAAGFFFAPMQSGIGAGAPVRSARARPAGRKVRPAPATSGPSDAGTRHGARAKASAPAHWARSTAVHAATAAVQRAVKCIFLAPTSASHEPRNHSHELATNLTGGLAAKQIDEVPSMTSEKPG